MADEYARLTGCAYSLFHAPFFTLHYGSTADQEFNKDPGSKYCSTVPSRMRTYEEAAAYPPNQAFIGNIDPRKLPERPWTGAGIAAEPAGMFGRICGELELYGLMRLSDTFDLCLLEESIAQSVREIFLENPVIRDIDMKQLQTGTGIEKIKEEISKGAVPLQHGETLAGCVKAAHPEDVTLNAHTILENLAAKATAVYSLLHLIYATGLDPLRVGYIIETSEEACGDMNQRGGGNFAKAIGEIAGLKEATGSDTRSFCAGPVHGLLQAAALVVSGVFDTVVVLAGGTTAKLGMNSKKHIEKGLPVLEDCMASFALLIEGGATMERSGRRGAVIRHDIIGRHKIGSGASPQAVIGDLVVEPLYNAGYRIESVDIYAPELQNPEITESAGAGNVTAANLKMIAAMAVMRKEINREDIEKFVAAHGVPGWAPTQGHIPSGIPALGWFLQWLENGEMKRGMVIGKGSLFLGRMTNLFDGVSILIEHFESAVEKKLIRLGLTIPGSESGAQELYRGAERAVQMNSNLEVVYFGTQDSDPRAARLVMEEALERGEIQGAVTFHYPFPIGVATVGRIRPTGSGKDLFVATTTGAASVDRVSALLLNTVYGVSAAKAYGISEPVVGFLNLDGAASAMNTVRVLVEKGWDISLGESARGEPLLRGNDVLSGTCDVVVCDTLTGNVIMKMIAAFPTGGSIETLGSGYGPGIGPGMSTIVNIISRASAASVVTGALEYAAKMVERDLAGIFEEEFAKAGKVGLPGSFFEEGGHSSSPEKAGIAKKVVDREIEGIDVLQLDAALEDLRNEEIYAEAGMGCSGPVIMVAEKDEKSALKVLRERGFIK